MTTIPRWVVSLVDENFSTLNADAPRDLEATFTWDAVLTDMQTGVQVSGAAEISEYMTSFEDLTVERTSAVVYRDDYATFTFRYGNEATSMSAVITFKIEDGQIAHQWIMADQPGGYGA